MTPTEKIDAALDSVLRASGSYNLTYASEYALNNMREAMRKIMVESYINGKSAAWDKMRRITGLTPNAEQDEMEG